MIESFGQTAGGQPVSRIGISGGRLKANIMNWGAVVQDLRLDGYDHPLVLGFDKFEHYPAHSPYFGAIVGRHANRISNGRFHIDGVIHRVDRNFLDKHNLHGGANGIGRQIWQVVQCTQNSVTMQIVDKDGANGFPGSLNIECTYSIGEDSSLTVMLTATTDAATLCNLAHHSYFNLDGACDVLSHVLKVEADEYLPVDDELIPTGKVTPVADTAFDFRTARSIQHSGYRRFDHNFCLSREKADLRDIAVLKSERSHIEMRIASTEPGLQVYTGEKVNTPVVGLTGKKYGPYSGIALEPQFWPDSPNNPDFAQAILLPTDKYRQVTSFTFKG